MNKAEMITYLKKIRPFINLSAVCENYNSYYPEYKIDYNNLRAVLNEVSLTRVSEKKLFAFITFIKNVLYKTVFEFEDVNIKIVRESIGSIVEEHCKMLKDSLVEEIYSGIYDQQQ